MRAAQSRQRYTQSSPRPSGGGRPVCAAAWRYCARAPGIAALALAAFLQNAAALDPSYLGELPDPKRITQDFKSSDPLDTLALQVAALTRLNRLVTEMAGDRYYTTGKYPTPDEARVVAAIRAVAEPLGAEAEATFDPTARGADTPRARWRDKVREYERGDELYARLMQLYFTPAFRATHDAKLAAKTDSQQKTRDALERGRRTLKGEKEPIPPPDYTREILFGVAMFALCLVGSLGLLRRTKITARPPYRFWVGFRRYTIEGATGTIANYSHHEVGSLRATNQYGMPEGGGGSRSEEAFTLGSPRGSEPIHLASCTPHNTPQVLQNAIGQEATVLWTARAGNRLYLSIYVHTRREAETHGATTVAFDELFSRPWWTLVPAVLLGYVIGDLAVGSEYSGAIGGLIAMPVWEILYRVLLSHRLTFARHQLNPLAKSVAAATRW